MYFHYGETEINYLKQKDKTLGAIIDKIGYIQREVDTDLFSSVVHHIVGQQISNKAQATIWQRLQDTLTIVKCGAYFKCRRGETARLRHILPQNRLYNRLCPQGSQRRI